jgi:post-segregation antitoxin (ccd killing protein)
MSKVEQVRECGCEINVEVKKKKEKRWEEEEARKEEPSTIGFATSL